MNRLMPMITRHICFHDVPYDFHSIELDAFLYQRTWIKVVSILGAMQYSSGEFGLMDVYIGMEALRLGLLVAVYLQKRNTLRWWKIALYALLYLAGAGAFTYWRLFIFESRRTSVDAGAMLSGYGSFGAKLLENSKALAVNLYRLVVSAYYKPLLVFGSYVDTADLVIGIVIALLAAGVVIVVLRSKKLDGESSTGKEFADRYYPLILIVVGLVGVIGGLAPVIFGGRELTYTITGDRFSYPGSISACMLLVGLIWLLKPRWLRSGAGGGAGVPFGADAIYQRCDL